MTAIQALSKALDAEYWSRMQLLRHPHSEAAAKDYADAQHATANAEEALQKEFGVKK